MQTVGTEGIGVHHMTARLKVSAVNGADRVGMREVPFLRVLAGTEPRLL